MPRKFFKQIFTVTVLSEDIQVNENIELDELHAHITDGDGSGQITCETVEIDAATAASLLIDQGSDPGFFQLSDTGDDLSEQETA